MNTLGDFPIQASKSIKTSLFSSPRPIVAERSALGTPNLKVWGSILGVFTLFHLRTLTFYRGFIYIVEKKTYFSPHIRENRIIYIERMTFSHQNSRKRSEKKLSVKLCVGNVFVSHVLITHDRPGHLQGIQKSSRCQWQTSVQKYAGLLTCAHVDSNRRA